MYPEDLSLERLTTRFSVSRQSMPAFSNKMRERSNAQNRLSYLPRLITGILSMPVLQPLKTELPPTKAIAFQPLHKVSVNCYLGF